MNNSSTHQKNHCMVVHAYYPLAETRVQRQAEALLALGYNVDVICIGGKKRPKQEMVRGVTVHRIRMGRDFLLPGFAGRLAAYIVFLLLAMFKLMRLYRTKKYGVVQVHNLPDFLVFCAWWPKLRGAKIILDIHDVMPEFFAERSGKSLDHFFVKVIIWQEQRACRFADQVITVTEPWRQALVKRGVPFEKTNVVMNVPDGGMFYRGVQPNPGTKADDQVNLIYHGVQAPRHGLDMILHAVNQLRDELPHLHFILHGNGDAHLDLKALAKALDLEDRVQFTSTFMSIDELPKFIMRGDIGVVPYHDDIFSGGILPTKVLEYVALGLPVITSQTPAIEAYFNEEMVEMFAPGDLEGLKERIVKLYHDTARRQQLVIQSEDFLKQYGWEVQTEGYTAMVNQLNQS